MARRYDEKELIGAAVFLITLGVTIGYYKKTIDSFDEVKNRVENMNNILNEVKISNARLEEKINYIINDCADKKNNK